LEQIVGESDGGLK